ncbi:hypothetical protein B7Y94_03450 [Candidatus Saccharibacteria bacterium 32-49-12]|nr:MAG: hypothetical protein B7Y94_03450 [Candidatus Saccharibacteria bacterium 32-49-12]
MRLLSIKTLPRRIWLSLTALARLLYFKPAYLLLAAVSSILFYELIFWFLNLGLLQYLLTSPFLSIGDKVGMLVGSYSGIFTSPVSWLALTLFAVSIFQGVAVAALVYSIRKERSDRRGFLRDLGGTGVAGILSVLGLGCAACGTSLITPILTFFFATSSVAVAEEVGFYSAVLALVVSMVTVYLAGLKVAQRFEHRR